jgi:hypothetical protein
LLGGAAAPASSSVCLQLTWEVGLPLSPVEFSSLCHSHKLSHSWLLGMCHHSRQGLSSQAQLVYLQFWEGFSSPTLWSSECPTLFATCLYCSYCLLLSFSFFPNWGVGLSRGLCWSGLGLSVGVPHTAKLTLSMSSQAVWVQVTGGPGVLLVSPFNMKWRFSVLAGGVEGSKFFLFLVVLPARCVSSISPRFHYRRHTFCFLPLAAILEFLG